MKLYIQLNTDGNGFLAARSLRDLAKAVEAQDGYNGDALSRRTLSSGFYEGAVPDLESITIN